MLCRSGSSPVMVIMGRQVICSLLSAPATDVVNSNSKTPPHLSGYGKLGLFCSSLLKSGPARQGNVGPIAAVWQSFYDL